MSEKPKRTPPQPTKGEKLLARHMGRIGLQFKQQHPIGPYWADFAFPDKKLVVEVEGGVHLEPSQVAYDKKRLRQFVRKGWHVYPIDDEDVKANPEKKAYEVQFVLKDLQKNSDSARPVVMQPVTVSHSPRHTQQKSPPVWKLIVSLGLDLVGMIPWGFVDVLYAPLYGLWIWWAFDNTKLAWLGVIEELLPWTDVIPTATITWIVATYRAGKRR